MTKPRTHTEVALLVPNSTYQEWAQAAADSGHTIDAYLISTVTIATRLKLLEGTQRLPLKGAAIDPLLAEAIRVNSRGTDWEHKADLLLATPALTPSTPLPQTEPATPVTTRTHVAQQLMARHGLPVQKPTKTTRYATIGGHKFSWNQTALVLAIWEHAQDRWTGRRLTDHAQAAGLPDRGVEPVIRQLLAKNHIEQRPHPQLVAHGPHRTARNQYRIAPNIAVALDTNNYGPA